jgi:hypothetical protein
MTVSMLAYLPVISLILCVTGSLELGEIQAAADEFPYLMTNAPYISQNFHDTRMLDSQSINATDLYFVETSFRNADQETKSFSEVYFVVMVTDKDGYGESVDIEHYGEKVWSANQSLLFSSWWNPQTPGGYFIKSFLVSDLENPQIITGVRILNVTVVDKIDKLGIGEENYRLHVNSINSSNHSVGIAYTYCDEIEPYMHKTNATLSVGDYASINAADAYLIGIEGDKAVFKFVANGGSDNCLL